VVGWVSNLDVGPNVVEAKSATKRAVHEQISATEIIDEEQKPYYSDNCFHNSENASGKKTGVGASDTDTLEDCWGVVIDSIDPGCVLPEE
jgi:hypothetical protein